MTLKERYQNSSEVDLLTIIESPSAYTPACVLVVKDILSERNITDAELHQIIIEVNTSIAKDKLENLDPINDDIKIHQSSYLSEAKVREIYLSEMKMLMEKKEGFRFDVWQYAVGGF